jgi:hypothetical protein
MQGLVMLVLVLLLHFPWNRSTTSHAIAKTLRHLSSFTNTCWDLFLWRDPDRSISPVLGKKTQKHSTVASFLSIFDPYNFYLSPPGHAQQPNLLKNRNNFKENTHCFSTMLQV